MKARLALFSPRWFGFPARSRSIGLLTTLLLASFALAADDPYWRWAVAKFGQSVASDPAQQSSVWGENADPDRDGIVNLLEYTADTDPLARTSLSDVSGYSPTAGPSPGSYPQLICWQRNSGRRALCSNSRRHIVPAPVSRE